MLDWEKNVNFSKLKLKIDSKCIRLKLPYYYFGTCRAQTTFGMWTAMTSCPFMAFPFMVVMMGECTNAFSYFCRLMYDFQN